MPRNALSKSLFFAGVEHGVEDDEVRAYRKSYGAAFRALGFDVNDPTLGKETGVPREQLLGEDALMQERSHITVAYLPTFSNGTLREVLHARDLGQLVLGFTDKGNRLPPGYEGHVDAWFTEFERLSSVLSIFLKPPGEYFTSAHTNNVRGDIFLFGQDTHEVAPHFVADVLDTSTGLKHIYHFCCEKSHVHELAQKLPTMLRVGKVDAISIVTKDGSPHDVQMHTIAQEVAQNQGYAGELRHFVIEKGTLYRICAESVRASRHLSAIEQKLRGPSKKGAPTQVAVLTGALSDKELIDKSGLFRILDEAGLKYDYQIISSDRTPETLREYCLQNRDQLRLVIAIAGGVPNLPIVAKGWLPSVPVISVPLDDRTDYALASLTTPKDRPIIVAGYGVQGLKKAGYLAREVLERR